VLVPVSVSVPVPNLVSDVEVLKACVGSFTIEIIRLPAPPRITPLAVRLLFDVLVLLKVARVSVCPAVVTSNVLTERES
jgi:hypothetical protein